MARDGAGDDMGDTITRVTSLCASCGTNSSKGTRRSGADALPKMSPGSRSRFPRGGLSVDSNLRSVSKGNGCRIRLTGTRCGALSKDTPEPSYTRS